MTEPNRQIDNEKIAPHPANKSNKKPPLFNWEHALFSMLMQEEMDPDSFSSSSDIPPISKQKFVPKLEKMNLKDTKLLEIKSPLETTSIDLKLKAELFREMDLPIIGEWFDLEED